jgi:hypothetical protein
VIYAVDELEEILETEPNDGRDQAQEIDLPLIVNGRVFKTGDRDVFRFKGRAGDEIVAEVNARRLRSPLDSLLRLTDETGKVLAWNDDAVYKMGHLHREMGVLTHHSDSYLRAKLPKDGIYCIEISDAQGRGSADYAYRLRLSRPKGDFALRVTPSSLNLNPGRASVIHVHALRRDGFQGEIKVRLRNAPKGFFLRGNVIPPGSDRIRMTLTAAVKQIAGPVSLKMEGIALVDGQEVVRNAVPADDRMQAFLWRHLVPSRELVAAVIGRGGGRALVRRVGEGPVEIPCGGFAQVMMGFPKYLKGQKIEFELSDPPAGVTLADVQFLAGAIELTLKADEKAAAVADNLIVNGFWERTVKGRKGKKDKIQRIWIGTLPAVPIKVVKQ